MQRCIQSYPQTFCLSGQGQANSFERLSFVMDEDGSTFGTLGSDPVALPRDSATALEAGGRKITSSLDRHPASTLLVSAKIESFLSLPPPIFPQLGCVLGERSGPRGARLEQNPCKSQRIYKTYQKPTENQ